MDTPPASSCRTMAPAPLNTTMHTAPPTCTLHQHYPTHRAASVWATLPWYAQLAVILLSRLTAELSGQEWAPYKDVLPQEVDLPALWGAPDVEALQCPYTFLTVRRVCERKEGRACMKCIDGVCEKGGVALATLDVLPIEPA